MRQCSHQNSKLNTGARVNHVLTYLLTYKVDIRKYLYIEFQGQNEEPNLARATETY